MALLRLLRREFGGFVSMPHAYSTPKKDAVRFERVADAFRDELFTDAGVPERVDMNERKVTIADLLDERPLALLSDEELHQLAVKVHRYVADTFADRTIDNASELTPEAFEWACHDHYPGDPFTTIRATSVFRGARIDVSGQPGPVTEVALEMHQKMGYPVAVYAWDPTVSLDDPDGSILLANLGDWSKMGIASFDDRTIEGI